MTVEALAALERDGEVQSWEFEQRSLRPTDVAYDVLFCGICHTDLHMMSSWGQHFPMVPGHEVVGRVTAVGTQVTRFAAGDLIVVGTIVDSCRTCDPCLAQLESYCQAGAVPAYDGVDRIDGSITRGGYAESGICDEHFVYAVPAGLDPAAVAPLLCAGITVYSPLRHWQAGPGKTVGVVGIGGLGHLAVKFGAALGAEVIAFTTSAAKVDDARRLGASEVVLTSDPDQLAAHANRLDFVLDTVSARYPMTPILQTLKLDGTLCSVGLPDSFDLSPWALATGRRSVASSGSGGTAETAEMLEFCARHQITADVEVVGPDQIREALRRLAANDVRYRFVLDRHR